VRLPFALAGIVIGIAGVLLLAWSRRALGRAFTMFPEPRSGASLVSAGPYRLARHPMYGGGLLLLSGVSLARTIPALILTAALGVLWWRKSIVEERRLGERYAGYSAYRERTPKRFFPYVA
jgi:protein-S-isoprenylcysteine O-methyltransferase Ste14